jgi:hypothetical protein
MKGNRNGKGTEGNDYQKGWEAVCAGSIQR